MPLFQAERCRSLAAECRQLALTADSKIEKTFLTNLAFSWNRLANQTDRYVEVLKNSRNEGGHSGTVARPAACGIVTVGRGSACAISMRWRMSIAVAIEMSCGGDAPLYFNEVLIDENLVFRWEPMPFTTEMMASEIPAAINPYSIAVAAVSSARNFRTNA